MRLRVQSIGKGIVEFITVTGPHRLAVEDNEVEKDTVSIGYPLRRDNDLVFVALPRQTLSGSFRVWVRAEDILPNGVFG
jgi:hypothetical protein